MNFFGKPDTLLYLESRGIRARGCFKVCGEPARFYRVTRQGEILGLDGAPAGLTEDAVWELLGQIEKISREEFDRAKEAARVESGRLDRESLTQLCRCFVEQYRAQQQGLWLALGRYDEETIRSVLNQAAPLLLEDAPAAQRRAWVRDTFAQLVQHRARLYPGGRATAPRT